MFERQILLHHVISCHLLRRLPVADKIHAYASNFDCITGAANAVMHSFAPLEQTIAWLLVLCNADVLPTRLRD